MMADDDDQTPVLPSETGIRRDLEYMTARWGELPCPAVFEFRAFGEGRHERTAKFSPEWIDDAIDWADKITATGMNVYSTRNPIAHDCRGSASDSDIIAAFFLWADCDDPVAAGNIHKFTGPAYSAAVITGRVPSTRVHTYWALKEPCFDLSAWRDMQMRIAAHFRSDKTVVNPSRIMRVGGTVAYPAKHKRERGYITELTTIRTAYDEPRLPVTLDQMGRVFLPVSATAPAGSGGLAIDTGPQPLDRERTRIHALEGAEWHNSVVRLVASYVSKGLSDAEIHGLTAPLTLAGYTADQTAAEVQTAIDGARRKGWTPVEYATPEFETPVPAIVTSHPERRLEWFDDIKPALSDNYVVKGVVGAGAMSVIYGPSNSGKTFFALDMAFHIAASPAWRGHRVAQAAVLYLAAEGGRGVANRIAALNKETGAGNIPFALRRAGMDLLHDQTDLQAIFEMAQEVQARASDSGLVIVIDTLSRVMAGGDENSAADMTALIRNIDAIRAATGAHIMLVHHTGKDTARGARGHSSLRAATDTEIEVQNSEDDEGAQFRAAMVTKQRDYQGGETFAFTLRTVSLGFDQDGDEVTSCVVEVADAEEFRAAKKAKKGIGGNQKLVLETFDQMIGEGLGTPNPGGVGMPETGAFLTVPLADLRAYCMGKFGVENKRDAWRAAWRALSEQRGVFSSASDLVWRTDNRKKR